MIVLSFLLIGFILQYFNFEDKDSIDSAYRNFNFYINNEEVYDITGEKVCVFFVMVFCLVSYKVFRNGKNNTPNFQ